MWIRACILLSDTSGAIETGCPSGGEGLNLIVFYPLASHELLETRKASAYMLREALLTLAVVL